MIHVCFGLYDKNGTYSKFTGTTILSLFENTTSPVTVHILHDNTLTQDNHDKFSQLAEGYGQTVKFYNVEELCAEKIAEMLKLIPFAKTARTSIGTFYKFLIMYVLPKEIEKVVYLDADIVVNLDINELWQVELGDRPLGAVPIFLQDKNISDGLARMRREFNLPSLGFVLEDDYFNAGVLVMNLKRLRGEEEKIFDGMKFRGEHPKFVMFDQCIWNYCFSTEYLKLPLKFNREVVKVRRQDGGCIEKKIYHFTANNSFWSFGMDMSDALNRLWLKYFAKTPWFNEEIIGHLYENFFQIQAELKKSTVQLSAAMSGKARAFIILEENFNFLVENFFVREDEEVIVVDEETSLQNLFDKMDSSRGKKIFFFLFQYFPLKILEEKGFVRGEDFVDGFKFLPHFDSYPLVAAM